MRMLAGWDELLSELGPDPAREDWTKFRPLRLSREEDWSDWLAHLLEQASSGRFPARLFAPTEARAVPGSWKVHHAAREISADEYRGDIKLRFAEGDWAHVEVKVGDLDLEKTPLTGDALRRLDAAPCRGDYLLLPDGDMAVWDAIKASVPRCTDIEVRTWTQVARALRESIIEPHESISWRAWARAFLGAVEQRLLGFPPVLKGETGRRASAKDLERLQFLESMVKA